MDRDKFEETVERLKEVNNILKDLDPAIKEPAFYLLETYVTGKPTYKKSKERIDGTVETIKDDIDKSSFFTKFDSKKPSDNVFLIIAFHYSQYGTAPITSDDVRQIADEVGITVPARIDMTIKSARQDGKSLFVRSGRGQYKPTVHGEKHLKETYKVSKGTIPKPIKDEE